MISVLHNCINSLVRNQKMAKKKKKIDRTLRHPKYRVQYHDSEQIEVDLGGGSRLKYANNAYVNNKFVLTLYKNFKYHSSNDLLDYTFISTEEELFQHSLLCAVDIDFSVLVQLQKALKHQMYQYIFPNKLEMINMKNRYVLDITGTEIV
ncbi:hypothetical protein RaK2_00363 [Klebsiella phage vB_KleM_RaK2]|uniref:Uncharacterized protein n=1 Tax=Klebsiella phage vB_KleM_RaK2 TaxID=1147094 RepID=H6X4H0_9CAUD|nr:hypothetical protein F403_gp172 [Klebsiella phage vB_KleM_RaK2]AFA44636.1 hypothetical protein RaK2_00363 [Klebsiella phage vB_KleM_RaK2]